MNGVLKTSIEASLFIQILTLIFNLWALMVPLDMWDFALKQILGLESFVQIIELVFYTWYRGELLEKSYDVTRFRYYDWFLTTPLMLFSTAAYYGYLAHEKESEKEPFSVWTFLNENSQWIALMLVFNVFMLLFGYLQEIGLISIVSSSLFGYLSLLGAFGILYTKFVSKTPKQQILFYIMFILWSLYGIAAALPSLQKNISYNVLDIFAKNFYGLFLGYLIFARRQN
jgi:bacteriorhodopsin